MCALPIYPWSPPEEPDPSIQMLMMITSKKSQNINLKS